MDSFMNGMFGKIAAGMCRLSMNGEIAVKTNGGYKTYNVANNRLTNCSNFVLDIGEDFFFVIPTNKVKHGDIILVGGKPKCVVKAEKETITVINYEDSTVESILPERHVFMGNTYFYGKIVSMFGNSFGKGKGTSKMMKYMMLSSMMKGKSSGDMGSLLPMMILMNGNSGEGLFDGLLDDTDDDSFGFTDSLFSDDDETEAGKTDKGGNK